MAKSFDLVFSDEFRKIVKNLRKKDSVLYDRLKKKMVETADNPYLGKPLRNILKNRWRIHIDSFVLVYRIYEAKNEIRFLDFDHHDKIYKK